MRRSPPRRDKNTTLSRRKLIGILGMGGVTVSSLGSQAFTSGSVPRNNQISSSSDEDGVVGLDIASLVSGGTGGGSDNEFLVEVTNNSTEDFTYTFTLQNGSDIVNFSATGTNSYTTFVSSGGSEIVRVDIEGGDSNSDTLSFNMSGESNSTSQSFFLTRSDIQLGGEDDPDPEDGEIDLVNNGTRGGSRNYRIEWSVGGDTSAFSGVNIFINGALEVEGAPLEDSQNFQLNSGDEVRADLIRNDGSVADSDSIII